MEISVIVAGATGRMGQEVVRMIEQNDHLHLVGAVSRSNVGKDIGDIVGLGKLGILCTASVIQTLETVQADVLIDFTTPEHVKVHAEQAILAGVRPVIGTSGLSEKDIESLSHLARLYKIGVIFAPNFAIGAVLMMQFAAKAALYMPHVEIIESHHDQKLDAPSGTAVKTAEMIARNRSEIKQGHPDEQELIDGARGAMMSGFRIHSVRLPGMVAHQEVIFGDQGQTLTIRHDSIHRESFMPGVKLAVEKVMELDYFVYGLENVLDF
ncbi:4-hydroxy-tetrahydrodipicolinate reductase [Hazenella sp. IB182357]|uniref:4-hydroxy-tetrahydrodipicolinate reductase n=1 Tax=Polycladospora coralii TaxID=2771432 RepID=A0A926RWK0_9BACL|nr:4-hydroxy-tetrahydrodipicolinate reductase [Polycladospora coralii]MBD1371596.1 4-hydroxy-tetrahydrodipicolinate reductase [Polycladospora coralii]